jgi:hypothetical protein
MSKTAKLYLQISQPLIDAGLFTEEEMMEGVEEKIAELRWNKHLKDLEDIELEGKQ